MEPFSFTFLDSSQLLPVEAVFPSTQTYWKRENEFFCLLETGGSQLLRANHISASGHQFFRFFQRFLI